jgi:hypothetical protein
MADSNAETIKMTIYFQREINGKVVASSMDMSAHGYIQLGTKEVEFTIAPIDMIEEEIKVLMAESRELFEECDSKMDSIDNKIRALRNKQGANHE